MWSGSPRTGSEVVYGRIRAKAAFPQNSGEKIDFFGPRKAILSSRRSVEVRIREGFLKDCLGAGPGVGIWEGFGEILLRESVFLMDFDGFRGSGVVLVPSGGV